VLSPCVDPIELPCQKRDFVVYVNGHHPQRLYLIALTEAARDPANYRAIKVSLGSTLDLLRSPVEIKKHRAKGVQKLVYQVGPARAPGVIEGKPEPALESLDIEQAR